MRKNKRVKIAAASVLTGLGLSLLATPALAAPGVTSETVTGTATKSSAASVDTQTYEATLTLTAPETITGTPDPTFSASSGRLNFETPYTVTITGGAPNTEYQLTFEYESPAAMLRGEVGWETVTTDANGNATITGTTETFMFYKGQIGSTGILWVRVTGESEGYHYQYSRRTTQTIVLVAAPAPAPTPPPTSWDGPTPTPPTPAPEQKVIPPTTINVAVPAGQVYKRDVCGYYPYTLNINTPTPNSPYSAVVEVEGPKGLVDINYVEGVTDANGDVADTDFAFYCKGVDGTGTFTYTATVDYVGTYVEQWWWNGSDWMGGGIHTSEQTSSVATVATMMNPATVTTKASTTRPKKNRTVQFTGKVTYKNDWWDTKTAKKQTVTMQYQAKGTTTWTNVATAKTSTSGKYKVKTRAQADGHYRVVYNTATTTGTSKAVYIDVR